MNSASSVMTTETFVKQLKQTQQRHYHKQGIQQKAWQPCRCNNSASICIYCSSSSLISMATTSIKISGSNNAKNLLMLVFSQVQQQHELIRGFWSYFITNLNRKTGNKEKSNNVNGMDLFSFSNDTTSPSRRRRPKTKEQRPQQRVLKKDNSNNNNKHASVALQSYTSATKKLLPLLPLICGILLMAFIALMGSALLFILIFIENANNSYQSYNDAEITSSLHFLMNQPTIEQVVMIINEKNGEEYGEEFSCGGGPFSNFWASLVSIPCDRPKIHQCCETHDRCYDTINLNQTYCDSMFCACMERIQTSAYCRGFAQPGLCLATKVFGHMFYAYANNSVNIN